MKKTIGIIGGMGPMATCDLMKKIFEVSDADCDQNYVHVCVDCNTNIPDRTKWRGSYTRDGKKCSKSAKYGSRFIDDTL